MIDVLTADLRAPLTEESAELYVGGTVFKTGPPRRVGVELEWLVHDVHRPQDAVPPERLAEALADPFDPPLDGTLSTEPGGQLELSSPPAPLARCLAGAHADLTRLRERLTADGLTLTGIGLDPRRPPVLATDAPRYVAMDRHFAARGPEGRLMMCSTASVQVCLDAGADEVEIVARWHALHAWLPVLVALFAHSPLAGGRRTGWRSARAQVWAAIDPSRTAAPVGDRPREAYARWALDARVLAIRRPAGSWQAPAGLSFRDWLRGAGPAAVLPPPTPADLDHHLSTLFPPVRARGHLELRALDAQPGDGWRVAAALVAGLLDDPVARDLATDAAAAATAALAGSDPLVVASRDAVGDPALRRAALAFTGAARAALIRAGQPDLAAEVDRFAARYPARGRCPADDLLDLRAPGEDR